MRDDMDYLASNLGQTGIIFGSVVAVLVLLAILYRWASRHAGDVKQLWVRCLQEPQVQALQRRFAPQLAFLHARLTPGSHLGLNLTVGALVLLGAAWLFGGIAEDVVTSEPFTRLDVRIANWFHDRATLPATRFMLAVSQLHSPLAITAYGALLALYLAWRRDWAWLTCLVVTIPSGMLLNVLLKYAFHRARPTFVHPLVSLATYSFPSGHAAGSMLFYGVLAALLVSRTRQWGKRAAIGLASFAMVCLVSFSRVYLGVHYVSDVVAGVAEATAWLALCLVSIHTFQQHRAARSPL